MNLDVCIRKQIARPGGLFLLDVRFKTDARRVVIFGPSASGKTLTLNAIAGLITPDSGHVRMGEKTFFDAATRTDLPPSERRIGYVFQNYALFPHLTVRQNIGFGLKAGWRNPHRRSSSPAVDTWLEKLNLQDAAHQYPATLSGGQQQRVALGRALIAQPALLLLDEPFSALDPHLQTTTRQELNQLLHHLQIPIILISHDPEDTNTPGALILKMEHGKIVEEGMA